MKRKIIGKVFIIFIVIALIMVSVIGCGPNCQIVVGEYADGGFHTIWQAYIGQEVILAGSGFPIDVTVFVSICGLKWAKVQTNILGAFMVGATVPSEISPFVPGPVTVEAWIDKGTPYFDYNEDEQKTSWPLYIYLFEPITLDHFKFYRLEEPSYLEEDVQLVDQFGAINATVGAAALFGNPVEKVHGGVTTPISDPDNHLTFYWLEYAEEPQVWEVEVDNQFNEPGVPQTLKVSGPVALAVPTQKEGHEEPECLDHFLVYDVIEGPDIDAVVMLQDQFGFAPSPEVVDVDYPVYFANPVQKTHGTDVTDITNEYAHLVFYEIDAEYLETQVQVANQFGEQTLNVTGPELLAVPSEKIFWGPL